MKEKKDTFGIMTVVGKCLHKSIPKIRATTSIMCCIWFEKKSETVVCTQHRALSGASKVGFNK